MKNIAFYGGGNISQAVIEGLIFSGLSPKNIFFVDRNTKNQNNYVCFPDGVILSCAAAGANTRQ